jgi:hypothetical protein
MFEHIEKLHKCADCPIRCRAVAKPRSIFARIHRWHAMWWPGWKIHQAAATRPRHPGSSARLNQEEAHP